jgi:predicted flavoprotein YhiN
MTTSISNKKIAIIGGGASGLMAADFLRHYPVQVSIYEAKPSVGRKFLLAGKGGMNITHSEEFASFVNRYGAEQQIFFNQCLSNLIIKPCVIGCKV